MYPVSNAFLQKIRENTREYYWTGTIVTTHGTRYSFQNADILKGSAYINHKSCSADEMELGSVNAAEMKITLFNNIDRYTLMDAEVRLTYHLRIDENTVEDVPMGVFIVTEANRNIKTLELVGYDRMLLLDKEFSVTDMVGTPYQILHLMAEACGIVLEQNETEIKALTNGTETFSIYTDNDIETWRDVLFYLAQAMCCFASFNREGKLELKQYGMTPVFEVNNTHRFTSSFSDFKTRYTAVSSTNLRTQMAEYYALETDDGLTMNLGTNPMLQYGLEATRKRIIERILYKLAEFEYVPFDSTTIGNPALDVGDVIVNRGGHADEDVLAHLLPEQGTGDRLDVRHWDHPPCIHLHGCGSAFLVGAAWQRSAGVHEADDQHQCAEGESYHHAHAHGHGGKLPSPAVLLRIPQGDGDCGVRFRPHRQLCRYDGIWSASR